MKNSNTIISAKNLTIGYQKSANISIAKNIHIDINEPKFITLIGRNGVGKSTLLKTLSKILEPLSGELFIKAKNIKDYDALSLAKQISIVLTERIPPSNLTVFEVVALARQIYTNWIGKLSNNDNKQINQALSLCEISHLKDNKIDELSDGQFQKVMLARAIAQDTPIIILDEPTAHLDIVNRIEIFNLLQKLAAKNKKLIICSTHEIQLCLHYATDIWLMTKDAFITDKKETILSNNVLSKVFNSDLIEFDQNKKQFIYK